MMIDVFSHVLPPRYLEERNKRAAQRLATAARQTTSTPTPA